MTIKSVGVFGCGVMGQGIARASAGAGLRTILYKVTPGTFVATRSKFEDGLEREVEKGRLSKESRATILANLTWMTHSTENFEDCDLLIESVVEDVSMKEQLFRVLDGMAKPGTIFASNTSTFSIMEFAYQTTRYKHFVGLHFFNPVSAMKLVEVVQTSHVEAGVMEEAQSFVRLLGKTPVVVLDSPGFLVNRLLTPLLLDAIRVFESGIASMESIDQSMKLGCNHPMGPLELCDYIGLDIVMAMAMNLYSKLREERFAPPKLLCHMVATAMLGRKTKSGFYDYTVDPKRPNFVQHL